MLGSYSLLTKLPSPWWVLIADLWAWDGWSTLWLESGGSRWEPEAASEGNWREVRVCSFFSSSHVYFILPASVLSGFSHV